MSKVSINESTLTAIGNAIREKTGKTALIAPGSMPAEIRGIQTGGGDIEVEPIVMTGDQPYGCSGTMASAYIKMFGDTISTDQLTVANNMFENSTLTRIPFSLNFAGTSYKNTTRMFFNCSNLVAIPEINNLYSENIGNMFEGCSRLRELPENLGENWNWSRLQSYTYGYLNNIFAKCYSLRRVPASFVSNLWGIHTSSYYAPTYNTFNCCYALDEIRDFPVSLGTCTSNMFSSFANQCYRLKSLTFATNEDGSPKTANWKSQTITLSDSAYVSIGFFPRISYITDYNSGITLDKQVTDDASYQALKNDPDWFTCNKAHSRYNHDSAVETINSLPDTSAYLASAGGTNTIKILGDLGSATDGGAVNTLTEAEIAVAAAKGWTVSLI